jgi:arylsulfatase A-like enzyme
MSRVKAKRQASTTDASKQRPNVVIFITDQERPTDLWMPKEWAQENLPTRKFLEKNGLSFTNAFANTNMCSSSRASFFTGTYPAQHGVDKLLTVTDNPFIRDQTQLSPDMFTIGDLLSDDYDVVYKGKWQG